jgi:hydrocephalus-inducing protein
MTTQFQNLQKIPVEFSFGEPQFVTKQVSDPQLPSALVFSPSPVNGVVQPACFQNIDITFTPESEDAFEVQIPYSITDNDQHYQILLKGSGVQLKLVFNPSKIVVPPVFPFGPFSSCEFSVVNPTIFQNCEYNSLLSFIYHMIFGSTSSSAKMKS